MAWPRECEQEDWHASFAGDKVIFSGRFEGTSVKPATQEFPMIRGVITCVRCAS